MNDLYVLAAFRKTKKKSFAALGFTYGEIVVIEKMLT